MSSCARRAAALPAFRSKWFIKMLKIVDETLNDKAGKPVERDYFTIIDGKRKMVVGHVGPTEEP
jgi:hypothetical protein